MSKDSPTYIDLRDAYRCTVVPCPSCHGCAKLTIGVVSEKRRVTFQCARCLGHGVLRKLPSGRLKQITR